MKLDLNNIINTKILLISLALTIFLKYIIDNDLENNIIIKIVIKWSMILYINH